MDISGSNDSALETLWLQILSFESCKGYNHNLTPHQTRLVIKATIGGQFWIFAPVTRSELLNFPAIDTKFKYEDTLASRPVHTQVNDCVIIISELTRSIR